MKAFMRNQDVRVVALCDVYDPQVAFAIKDAKLEGAQTHKDFRRILDDVAARYLSREYRKPWKLNV